MDHIILHPQHRIFTEKLIVQEVFSNDDDEHEYEDSHRMVVHYDGGLSGVTSVEQRSAPSVFSSPIAYMVDRAIWDIHFILNLMKLCYKFINRSS